MAKDKLTQLEERKRKLEEQIKEEKEKDLLRFAKWFYSNNNVDNYNDAKELVTMLNENKKSSNDSSNDLDTENDFNN